MIDRTERAYFGIWACLLQSFFATVTVLISAALVFFAGGISFGRDDPFRANDAVRAASIIFLPVAAIVASAVLLWFRSRWGWYVTIAINLSLESILVYDSIRNLLWHHHHASTRNYHFDRTYWMMHLILLPPLILLFLPDTRRDYLGYRPVAFDVSKASGNQQV